MSPLSSWNLGHPSQRRVLWMLALMLLGVVALGVKEAYRYRVIRDYLVLGPDGRRADPRIGRERHALIMSGAAILQTLMRVWPTRRLSVADRGLREGLLYAQMVKDGVLAPDGMNGVA